METQTEGEADLLRWVEELQRRVRVEVNSRRIFERYYGWVRGFFTRRRISLARAEELAQETFLHAFQKIRSFHGGGSFESWLFAIAANLHRNEKRHLSRQKRTAPRAVMAASPGSEIEIADAADSPELTVFKRERLRALELAIERLPLKPRDCIRLRLAGYDYPAIAELLRLSPSTARVHVFTARQRLREDLGDQFKEWIG